MKAKLQQLKKIAARTGLIVTGASAVEAHAATTAPDFSALTSGIDFSTVTTGVLAVAATLITVYVGIKGAKILIGMVRGA
ncbi:phage-related membrane protein [Pandoraea eparura]|uniref:Phage-related membrane protein n=1 Tax=Pandoraea eparura TaxID=2508291 RepID=A0A5E4SA66_9BURK|nr:major capsid protein [Pandoraea eparura]VVD71702.1 phage-related membrane protein [Pandoraea eparura]